MLTFAGVRQVITIPRVLTLNLVFLAACTTQQAVHPYQYKKAYSDDIHITTKSGQEYELNAPWTSDAIGNISGKGKVLVEDEWEPFEGEIQVTDIDKVTTTTYNSANPALIYGISLGVLVIALVVLIVTTPINIFP